MRGLHFLLFVKKIVNFSGDAQWATLSEQERQKKLVKLKLEERRMRKEGQMDELQRLLGEGFEMDANLRKLMGENKARFVIFPESSVVSVLVAKEFKRQRRQSLKTMI